MRCLVLILELPIGLNDRLELYPTTPNWGPESILRYRDPKVLR